MELIGCSHTSMNTPLTPPTTRLCHQVALGALCIPQMHCRQRNECALSDKIACIQRVVESRASIQYLLEDEDYLGALEVGSRAAMTHSRTPSHTPALQNVTYYMLFNNLSPLLPPPPPPVLPGDPRVPYDVRRRGSGGPLSRAGDGAPGNPTPPSPYQRIHPRNINSSSHSNPLSYLWCVCVRACVAFLVS